jgi:glycosyltransferase involved in cell wall biosynthesis
MRSVAIYSNTLLPYSETFIRDQLLALRRWRPLLLGERRDFNGLQLDDIAIKLLRPNSRIGRWLHAGYRLLRVPDPANVRQLRSSGVSLVHAHFGTCAVDVWPLVRASGLPMMVTLHGYDINVNPGWWEAGHGGRRRKRYPRQLRALAHERDVRFLAVSAAVRERAIQYGIPTDRVTVRYIGVDTEKFRPGGTPMAQRAHRILFVGRLVEKKGAANLIDAFSAVRQSLPQSELVIIGDGPLRTSLEEQASALNLPVTFLGAISSDEVRKQMDEARILCLPSVTAENGDAEGFGLVLLEAQACGLPVVTSARGGAHEGIQDGITGFAVAESDPDALAGRLAELLADLPRLERMSQSATCFARRDFDLYSHTAALEADYDRLVNDASDSR